MAQSSIRDTVRLRLPHSGWIAFTACVAGAVALAAAALWVPAGGEAGRELPAATNPHLVVAAPPTLDDVPPIVRGDLLRVRSSPGLAEEVPTALLLVRWHYANPDGYRG